MPEIPFAYARPRPPKHIGRGEENEENERKGEGLGNFPNPKVYRWKIIRKLSMEGNETKFKFVRLETFLVFSHVPSFFLLFPLLRGKMMENNKKLRKMKETEEGRNSFKVYRS